jgi:hypothetical protein
MAFSGIQKEDGWENGGIPCPIVETKCRSVERTCRTTPREGWRDGVVIRSRRPCQPPASRCRGSGKSQTGVTPGPSAVPSGPVADHEATQNRLAAVRRATAGARPLWSVTPALGNQSPTDPNAPRGLRQGRPACCSGSSAIWVDLCWNFGDRSSATFRGALDAPDLPAILRAGASDYEFVRASPSGFLLCIQRSSLTMDPELVVEESDRRSMPEGSLPSSSRKTSSCRPSSQTSDRRQMGRNSLSSSTPSGRHSHGIHINIRQIFPVDD